MLAFENAGGEGFGGVVGEDGAPLLEDDLALVVLLSDEVDGASGFGFAGGDDGFVDVEAVHAFAAEFGKEGGMDVEDALGEGGEDGCGEEAEVAGERDMGSGRCGEGGEKAVAVGWLVGFHGDDGGGDAELNGALEAGEVGFGGDDDGDFGGQAAIAGGGDEVGHVAAPALATDEDGESGRHS